MININPNNTLWVCIHKQFFFFSDCFMADTARVNAQTLWKLKGNAVRDSRSFGFEVVRGLVTPHILQRMNGPGLQNYVKLCATAFLGKACFSVLDLYWCYYGYGFFFSLSRIWSRSSFGSFLFNRKSKMAEWV